MIKIPIDPYWENAIRHWIFSRSNIPINSRQEEIDLWWQWLEEQGVVVHKDKTFNPYLEFTCDKMATAFMLRWA